MINFKSDHAPFMGENGDKNKWGRAKNKLKQFNRPVTSWRQIMKKGSDRQSVFAESTQKPLEPTHHVLFYNVVWWLR